MANHTGSPTSLISRFTHVFMLSFASVLAIFLSCLIVKVIPKTWFTYIFMLDFPVFPCFIHQLPDFHPVQSLIFLLLNPDTSVNSTTFHKLETKWNEPEVEFVCTKFPKINIFSYVPNVPKNTHIFGKDSQHVIHIIPWAIGDPPQGSAPAKVSDLDSADPSRDDTWRSRWLVQNWQNCVCVYIPSGYDYHFAMENRWP